MRLSLKTLTVNKLLFWHKDHSYHSKCIHYLGEKVLSGKKRSSINSIYGHMSFVMFVCLFFVSFI